MVCCLLLAAAFRLIRHYISGENALLRLFAFDLEGCQRAEQLVHFAGCHVLAVHNLILVVTVHGCVHVGWYDVLFNLWALLSLVACI